MSKTHTVLQVFVASPGDLKDERSLIANVINEFNQTWGSSKHVTLELIGWETHSRPGIGEDGQDVINHQIGDDYDIFLGLMWGRFGTATNRADSGTEEEFERAYSRLRENPESVQIMFYFKDAGISPSKMDTVQLQKVLDFKKKIADEYGALYHEFQTPEQFETKVRMHLSSIVQDWLDGNILSQTPKTKHPDREVIEKSTDPLANLSALDMEADEEGIVELVETASDAMLEITGIINRMSSATNDLTQQITSINDEAKEVSKGDTDIKHAKRVSNKAAEHLELFVKRMAVEIREFNKQSTRSMDTFGSIAMIAESDLEEDPKDIAAARLSIQSYADTLKNSITGLRTFRNIIFGLPRMTTAFNRAKKRAVAVMDDLLTQLEIAASQSNDVDALLARLCG
jgi:ferritin-like protein